MMSMSAIAVAISPVLGLLCNSLFLVMLYRLRPAFGLLRAEYAGFFVGAVSVLAINVLSFICGADRSAIDMSGHAVLTLLSYSALGYCHFHFVNLGETARRIRLLRELLDAGGELSHADLLMRYNSREVIEKRIRRLISTGQVDYRDGRYYISDRTVLRIARFIILIKRLLLGKESEFDQR